jgi:hypothetical protein
MDPLMLTGAFLMGVGAGLMLAGLLILCQLPRK